MTEGQEMTPRESTLIGLRDTLDEYPRDGRVSTSWVEANCPFLDGCRWPERRALLRELDALRAEGLVTRHGGSTYAYWSLTKKGRGAIDNLRGECDV